MFEWFTNLLTSIITFILSLFGLDSSPEKKAVRFADEVNTMKEENTTETPIDAQ
jgi:hypothetical protein